MRSRTSESVKRLSQYMGIWDGYMMFLHGIRSRLGYMIDSKESWFVMAVDLVLCLIYSQILLVQFGDAIVSLSYDNICGWSMG